MVFLAVMHKAHLQVVEYIQFQVEALVLSELLPVPVSQSQVQLVVVILLQWALSFPTPYNVCAITYCK